MNAFFCSSWSALARFALALPALLFCLAPALAGEGPGAPERHVIVRTAGQGATPDAAAKDALTGARAKAARYLAGIGGAAALDEGSDAQRILASQPLAGGGMARTLALVQLRLKPMQEPPPAALALPVITVKTEDSGDKQAFVVDAARACEALVLLVNEGDASVPAGGAVYKLAPGKPMRQALPREARAQSARVLACTGGLALPPAPGKAEDVLDKARAGKPRPGSEQGVVSDCVTLNLPLALSGVGSKRSMRAKSSESPVNMTGAAGRAAGLPLEP